MKLKELLEIIDLKTDESKYYELNIRFFDKNDYMFYLVYYEWSNDTKGDLLINETFTKLINHQVAYMSINNGMLYITIKGDVK